MPIAERLRALDEPEPGIDLDRALVEVRRRARKHRQVRAALLSGAAVVLIVAAGAGLLPQGGDHGSQVDTIDGAEVSPRLDGLVPLLLEDDAVLRIVPELAPKTDYSTGETYGQIPDHELVGPTGAAVTGVVRQWSQDGKATGAGAPYTVISTVIAFPTAEAATDAADAMLALLPESTDVGNPSVSARMTQPGPDGFSDGVGVATTGPLLVAVQVSFVGEADRSVVIGLVDAVADRTAAVISEDRTPAGSEAPSPREHGLAFEPFSMRYRTISSGGSSTVEAEWVLDYTSTEEWTVELLTVSGDPGGLTPGARQSLSDGRLTQTFGSDEPGSSEDAAGPLVPLALLNRGPLPDGDVNELFGQPASPVTLDGRDGYRSTRLQDCPDGSLASIPGCTRPGEQITVVEFHAFNNDGVPVFSRTYVEGTGETLWQFEVLEYEQQR